MRINKLILTILLTIAFALSAQVNFAQEKRKPSTPEERARAVMLIRMLESEPLNKDAKDARRWLLQWLSEVPDITVTITPDFLRPIFGKEKNYAGEIFFQMTLSSAAFIIENPDKANDEQAVNVAGLEGSLKAYESILKVKPKAKWEFLDGLIEKRNKGELDEYVAEILKNEKKNN
jgi:hypothetical protein